MMLWGWYRGGTAFVGDPEVNAPSLWSGGVEWDGVAPVAGYWQTSANPTARTGVPDISVAIGGEWVNNTVRQALWDLGRSGWLDPISASAATIEVEGAVTASVMDEVVIGVLSDVTDQHSDPLWVGYVDTINTTTETSGRIVTSVSCINVIGRLGQAAQPEWAPEIFDLPRADLVERLGLDSGAPLAVVDNVTSEGATGAYLFDEDETPLAYLTRIELYDNLSIFIRGDGKLVMLSRSPLTLDTAPTPVALAGSDAPSTWTVQMSPTTVVNHWGDAGFELTTAMAASREAYGKRTYGIPELADTGSWGDLNDSGVMYDPRPLLTNATFPITDLGHAALFLDPSDWVTLDGETYEVLSVRHDVAPGHYWTTSITGDSTQPALHEASE